MLKKWLRKFNLFHLILIAVMAALGVGVKPVVSTLAHLITGPLFIPGGVVAGGIYMLFLVLAASLTRARGAGALCGLCQGLLVLVAGVAGSHGALSLVTYPLPGLAVDLAFFIFARKESNLAACCAAGMLANLAGTLSVNFAFFSMPLIPLLLSLFAAALSGGLGGVAAHWITKQLKRWEVLQ
ncbi:MAG: ECF transporter S component [Oscillospiraceae bacterium]|nr:ECF transporter S component [Oscillospiraceae bacterium]